MPESKSSLAPSLSRLEIFLEHIFPQLMVLLSERKTLDAASISSVMCLYFYLYPYLETKREKKRMTDELDNIIIPATMASWKPTSCVIL